MGRLSIHHVTRYRYRKPVALGEHRMMFRPREAADQRLNECEIHISPRPAHLRFVEDVFGNSVGVAEFAGRTDELIFDSRVTLEHKPSPAFDMDDGASHYSADDLPDLAASIERAHPDPVVDEWARKFAGVRTPLSDMTSAIHGDFRYNTRLEIGVQTPAQTLELARGSCRDFAVLMIDAARSLGLAAQFVSGYIYSPRSGGRIGGGHTHAWVRVYLPTSGWVEFDPTNGIVGAAGLIRVAVARDPRQAVPLHGTWTGRRSDYLGMDVTVDVRTESHLQLAPAPAAAAG